MKLSALISELSGVVHRPDNSADNNYLRDNLQEARWFLKSLQSRRRADDARTAAQIEHSIVREDEIFAIVEQ